MDKVYKQDQVEPKWYKFWEENGYFKADPNSPKKPYGLLIPPPNVTGELHLGHAMEHSIMDAIARFKRMQGFDVLLLPGVDHAGIQFEGTLNKLLEKEGLNKQKLGREAWLKRAWQFKDEVYNSVSATWRVMGLSADWSREVFTLDPKVTKAVLYQFQTFWNQDLLYKGAYIVQWCPKDQTAIEDLEMEYEERKEKLYFVKYAIKEMGHIGEYIVVATARPETVYADTGIAVYPNHPEFSKYVGMNAQNPLTEAEIPIFEDKRVDEDFGTGALKITPGHDPLDYDIGKDQGLPIYHAIDKKGRMTKDTVYRDGHEAKTLEGLTIKEAREKTIEILNDQGAIERVENYTHSVPVCERCKTTIEPLISEEWFIKMQPLAHTALKRIHEVNFIPKNYQKILSDWIKEIHDWCISRPLWWGYRMPVWYCQKCNPNHEVGKDKDMVISMDHPKQNCQTCKLNRWVQDEQLLDTWFSSGLWPMATLGWPEETAEFKKYFPWDFETSAPEIKFLWIARMIMLSLWFTDKIPFKNQFFHGMLRDLQGRKFSKSLGNGIDPNQLRAQWGTDAVRMALYSYSAPGRDGRTSKQIMDERCKNYRNFATKLWNITRFILINADGKEVKYIGQDMPKIDARGPKELTWCYTLIDERVKLAKEITKHIENFQLHLATDRLYEYTWHTFADNHIEVAKAWINKENKYAPEVRGTLIDVLTFLLVLLHPFMPFISEELWQKLPHKGRSIMITHWPKPD